MPLIRRCRLWSVLTGVVVGAGACSDGAVDPPTPTPANVTLSVSQLQFVSLGQSTQVNATVRSASGATLTVGVTWQIDNPEIASVSSSGTVTAVANGTTTLRATAGTVSTTAGITVAQVAAGIVLTPSPIVITSLNDTTRLTAQVRDAGGSAIAGAQVTFTSDNHSVATISAAGVITAHSVGNAAIVATSGAGSAATTVTVTQAPALLTVNPSAIELAWIGETLPLQVSVRDAGGSAISDGLVNWSILDTNVARVSTEGVVTAVGNGSTRVLATAGTLVDTVEVLVEQQPATITVTPDTVYLLITGALDTLQVEVRDAGGTPIPQSELLWSTSDATIATVTSAGIVRAVNGGTASIVVAADAVADSAAVVVTAGRPVIETIDPFLATPAASAIWEMPVLVVRFLPTADGTTIDQSITGFPSSRPVSLEDVERRIDIFDRRVKFMLEEGSRFRAYADPAARPSLGYRVVHYLTFFESMPLGPIAGPCEPSMCQGNAHFPDYHQILARANAEYWVNVRGVKEIWVWGYHHGNMVQPESNMASPTTGDISNSYRRNDDLPVFNQTYTLYGYNYTRGQNEAVHNHGHQLEAILAHADHLQNGNSRLFWRRFVGQNDAGAFITGRAGWTHMPPNTTDHYDYHDTAEVLSDIEDWRSDNTGIKRLVSNARWRDLVYNWPTGSVPTHDWPEDFTQGSMQRTEAQWYIYWMQNMPGLNNHIPHFSGEMTNWWYFTGDWDAAIRGQTGLATVPNGAAISIRNDYVGSILLQPGGTLQPGQSVTLYAEAALLVGVYDCGHPGATGCIMDQYSLTPGRNYRVITHPDGPAANLTIVEQ